MPNTSWNIMVSTTTQIQQKGLRWTLQHGSRCFLIIKWCNAKWVQTTSHATKLPHFTTQYWNKFFFSFIHIHKRNTRTQYQLQETSVAYSFLIVVDGEKDDEEHVGWFFEVLKNYQSWFFEYFKIKESLVLVISKPSKNQKFSWKNWWFFGFLTMVVYKTSYLKVLRTNKFNTYPNWYLTGIYTSF